MSDKNYLAHFRQIQQAKNLAKEFERAHISEFFATRDMLNKSQAKKYLEDPKLFTRLEQSIQLLLQNHQLFSKLSHESVCIIHSSLKLFSNASKNLVLKNKQYELFNKQCNQLLCRIINMNKKNFFNSPNHYYEPLILELKDYLKIIAYKDSWQNFYSHFLHLLDPISLLLLGVETTEQKKNLPQYTATKKLIELLEYNKSPAFSAEERAELYKGDLGELVDKYHVNDFLLDEHTHLPIQK